MSSAKSNVIPMPLKIAFTSFMAILVPSYWLAYGPTNFLYFCDIALFITLAAIWLESSLLASTAAIGVMIPQSLWVIDFSARILGFPPTDMTAYMFDENLALFYRGLSTFHGWMPFLIVFVVARLGYHRLGFIYWTIVAEAAIIVSYLWMPAPGRVERIAGQTNAPVNINYVYGFSDTAPQTWMPEQAWVLMLMIALPALIFLPTHFALKRWKGHDKAPLLETEAKA